MMFSLRNLPDSSESSSLFLRDFRFRPDAFATNELSCILCTFCNLKGYFNYVVYYRDGNSNTTKDHTGRVFEML